MVPNSCVQTQRGKEQTFIWKQLKGKQSGLNQVWIKNTGSQVTFIQRSCATEPLFTPEECSQPNITFTEIFITRWDHLAPRDI